jgi:hypothetical protein
MEVNSMSRNVKLAVIFLVVVMVSLGICATPFHLANMIHAATPVPTPAPTPPPTGYTLTVTAKSLTAVSLSGTSATFSISPGGTYAYGSTQSFTFLNGQQVKITANNPTPSPGLVYNVATFVRWEGEPFASPAPNPLTVNMDHNINLVACYNVVHYDLTKTPTPSPTPTVQRTPTATPPSYVLTLTLLPAGPCTVDVNPPGITTTGTTQTYPAGTVVTLKANNYYDSSGASYVFYQWQGDLTGSVNPATITMNGNKTIKAQYAIGDPPPPTTPPIRTPTPPAKTATPPVQVTPTVPPVTPTPPIGGLKVQFYNQSTAAISNQIYPNFKLVNTGSAVVALSNVKIRYYYTVDGAKPQNFYCDYSPVGSANVTGTFVAMTNPKTGADTYLEVGFTSGAGSLAAGANVIIQSRFAKNDWSNYTQTNDYSFNTTATTYGDWTKVTVYVSGIQQWGVEP